MNFILLIIFIISIAYLLIISVFSIGWFILGNYYSSGRTPSAKVSVIIPVRNEEENIVNCLNDIILQQYPKELYEIIVVDDFSEDKTIEVIQSFIKTNNVQNIRLLNTPPLTPPQMGREIEWGKKAALMRGINEASGELLITTDADCRMGSKWLVTIADYYENKKPKMLIGTVCFSNENNVFKKLQSLEFLSLIGITAGSAAINKPLMCNGANLAFEKNAFIETGGYSDNSSFASGDDMFTMEAIHWKYKKGVHFLKSRDAIVYTEPEKNINDFLHQRKRWVSKTKGYKSFRIIFVALIVYLFNVCLLGLLVLSLINDIFSLWTVDYGLWTIFICLYIAKCLVDFPILSGITGFMNKKQLLKLMIPLEFINIIYVSVIGIIGSFSKFKWKNRTLI